MTQTNSKPLILIVDDDRTMRSLLNLAMSEEGYEIAEAQNGEQCLSEYVNCRPDLILLDAVMLILMVLVVASKSEIYLVEIPFPF